MHEVLVNRLGGLSLPRKSVVRLTDRPDMTLDVYRGHKTTTQQQQQLVLYAAVYLPIAADQWLYEANITILKIAHSRIGTWHKLVYPIYPAVRWGVSPSRMTSNN